MHAPAGTCFLDDADLGSTLYVREAYIALHKRLDELKKKKYAHVVISGNEGVGKSWCRPVHAGRVRHSELIVKCVRSCSLKL